MKTVKGTNGEVKRVDDSTAMMMVSSGQWEYCGKEEYKKLRKTKVSTENVNKTDDIENRGLSDKKLRKERKRAKAERNKNRN